MHKLVYTFVCLHSQDGEIDLKLLTKVLAPEHEVREVSSHRISFSGLCPFCGQLAPQHERGLPVAHGAVGVRWGGAGEVGCDRGKRSPSCDPAIPLLAG